MASEIVPKRGASNSRGISDIVVFTRLISFTIILVHLRVTLTDPL